jgi:hypothetical protein
VRKAHGIKGARGDLVTRQHAAFRLEASTGATDTEVVARYRC